MAKQKPKKPAAKAAKLLTAARPPQGEDLAQIAAELRPLAVRLVDLTPDPANARAHGEESIESIRASLRKYGQRKPIVVNRRGLVIEAGSGTWEAARLEGWDWIAAVHVDDDPAAAAGYAIADNRTAELSSWDSARLLEALGTADYPEDLADALLIAQLTESLPASADAVESEEGAAAQRVPEKWQLVVTCADEQHQKALWDELEARGLECRPLTM